VRSRASDLLVPLRREPATAGIFTDFDGTLSSIVTDPASAEPVAGVPELLGALAGRYAMVAVVSGRPLSFLAARFPPAVLLVGLYGMERRRGGVTQVDPAAERWRGAVEAAATQSDAGAARGVLVERKGLSVTLHFRGDPTLESATVTLARRVAAATHLEVHPARKSVELRPPVHTTKGTVVEDLAAGLSSACYLGDDVGDLDGFRALDHLASRGAYTVRVAVRSDEAPADLLRGADETVDGPDGAAALLRTLLPETGGVNVTG
jgi:trehalose 6-phosphate phosphatase